MKKVGIICKPDVLEPPKILADLVPWLLSRGIEVYSDKETASIAGVKNVERSELPELADLVIVLGGDGTMLAAARLVAEKGIPVLGVNLGGLGFITEVYTDELYMALDKILKGQCPSEKRMMLSAKIIRNGTEIASYSALNDVVINKGAMARIIDLRIDVNKTYVTMFKSDGAIVATPTGSTAYSLSSGGPILYPTIHAMVLTPISPHTLTNRPLVLPEDACIEITLKSQSGGALLALDGQVSFTLDPGDTVEVIKSRHNAILMKAGGRDHFDVLRTKLKWGER